MELDFIFKANNAFQAQRDSVGAVVLQNQCFLYGYGKPTGTFLFLEKECHTCDNEPGIVKDPSKQLKDLRKNCERSS